MRASSILKRVGTDQTFNVTFLSHWSDIVNVNDPNDNDCIKWIGSDEYIGASSGHKYLVVGDRPLSMEEYKKIIF